MRFFINLIFIFIFIRCNSNENQLIRCSDLIKKDGLIKNSNKPFSGTCKDTTNGVIELRSYLKGIPNGEWKKFHANGTVAYEGNYSDGKIDGEFVSYHTNGVIKGIGKIDMGYKVGAWIYYDSLGIEIQKKMYTRDGLLIE